MGIVNNAQDIFPAVTGTWTNAPGTVHNGALIVNPGSPVSFGTGVLAVCTQNTGVGGLSQGNGSYTSWGVYGRLMMTYPAITGTAVTGLGKAGNSAGFAISGQYHVATEPRYDAVRYYTQPTGIYGTPQSISGTYQA